MNQQEMNKAPKCNHCKFVKMYDYGKKIYYCDNEDRMDDMGKLSVGELAKGSPEWCPLKCKEK